jgi:hypothetical protein
MKFTGQDSYLLSFACTYGDPPYYVMQVTIGADHRVVDGATVARFCNEWKSLVEKPELLLLHMR